MVADPFLLLDVHWWHSVVGKEAVPAEVNGGVPIWSKQQTKARFRDIALPRPWLHSKSNIYLHKKKFHSREYVQ